MNKFLPISNLNVSSLIFFKTVFIKNKSQAPLSPHSLIVKWKIVTTPLVPNTYPLNIWLTLYIVETVSKIRYLYWHSHLLFNYKGEFFYGAVCSVTFINSSWVPAGWLSQEHKRDGELRLNRRNLGKDDGVWRIENSKLWMEDWGLRMEIKIWQFHPVIPTFDTHISSHP